MVNVAIAVVAYGLLAGLQHQSYSQQMWTRNTPHETPPVGTKFTTLSFIGLDYWGNFGSSSI